MCKGLTFSTINNIWTAAVGLAWWWRSSFFNHLLAYLLVSGWIGLSEDLLGFLRLSHSLLEETLQVLIPLLQPDDPLLPQSEGSIHSNDRKEKNKEEVKN